MYLSGLRQNKAGVANGKADNSVTFAYKVNTVETVLKAVPRYITSINEFNMYREY